ncbi:methyltransferase domain-containing protein [Christiangramia sabulilitoris]|uniref:Methyltransferase domain-containing protein n=1 Tax=Christiangramia sabulilitoris TaxID=2583991 RepID=A0A550I6M8_9FLAO|nr:methyltransferase domain-containing protein [Christiangramia sabulilitoris]TRO66468.1 methyltransferase domain-containing protein [Christiangramia sabulilitoris]
MYKIDTSIRSDESEIMDNFKLQGSALGKTLDDLENINTWLGGNRITIKGVEELLKNSPTDREIRIADIGCGNGAVLRKISAWAGKKNYKLQLTGIDANDHAIKIGEELSADHSNLDFKCLNIFSEEFKQMKFDIILCTLTLHHFKDQQIINLLDQLTGQAELGIVINDLHRSSTAYFLFKAFCAVFVNNDIARKDGLISILRGFKKEDLAGYKDRISASNHSIKWKWAFRYQWIIKK